jgi:hypothetical protein
MTHARGMVDGNYEPGMLQRAARARPPTIGCWQALHRCLRSHVSFVDQLDGTRMRQGKSLLRVGAKLREQRLPKAAELVEGGIEET